MPYILTSSSYCIFKQNTGILEYWKTILQNAKLANINKRRLIYYPHRHFQKYIFSNLKWVKNDFCTYKLGDYLQVCQDKGRLTMVKNRHSAYIF